MRIQTEILVEKYRQHMFAAALSACADPQDAAIAGAVVMTGGVCYAANVGGIRGSCL